MITVYSSILCKSSNALKIDDDRNYSCRRIWFIADKMLSRKPLDHKNPILFSRQLIGDRTVCYETLNIFPVMTATFFALNAQMLKRKVICNLLLPFTLNKDREVTGNWISDINSFSTAEYHFYCYNFIPSGKQSILFLLQNKEYYFKLSKNSIWLLFTG